MLTLSPNHGTLRLPNDDDDDDDDDVDDDDCRFSYYVWMRYSFS